MSQKVYPITADHLFGILNHPKFRENIGELNNDLDYERAFTVFQAVYSSIYNVGDVKIGTPDNAVDFGNDANDYALLNDFDQRDRMVSGEVMPFILLHIHSHASGGVVPSVYGDLVMGLSGDRMRESLMPCGLLVKPIGGIVAAFGRPTIELLLIQEDTKMPVPRGEADYLEQLIDQLDENDARPDEVAEALEGTGLYHALALKFNRGKLPKRYIELLRRFEFTPEIAPSE